MGRHNAGRQHELPSFPASWLLVLLPFGYGWGVLAVAKVLVAGLGTYALSRALNAGRGGALVAGTIYMLSGPLMLWLQYPLGSVFALFPWLLLATTRLSRDVTPGSIAGVGVAVALTVLAGHPESALIAVSAVAAYLIALIAFDRRPLPALDVRCGWPRAGSPADCSVRQSRPSR